MNFLGVFGGPYAGVEGIIGPAYGREEQDIGGEPTDQELESHSLSSDASIPRGLSACDIQDYFVFTCHCCRLRATASVPEAILFTQRPHAREM